LELLTDSFTQNIAARWHTYAMSAPVRPSATLDRRIIMGRIRERMEADLKLKGFASTTCKEYLLRARHFVAYCQRSPEQLGEEDIRRFLLHLVEERGVRAGTHRMYVAALKFLFAVTLKRPEMVTPSGSRLG
jgi:hypothetical protein